MDHRLYELTWQQFEALVGLLCAELLGIGTVVFSEGRDGGRDGRFTGTAQSFPSTSSPWSGEFVVQAKHTGAYGASCSDTEFESEMKKEKKKVAALADRQQCNNYLVFTNRKLTAGQHEKLKTNLLDGSGVKNVEVIGLEKLNLHLDARPDLVRQFNLGRSDPLRIEPSHLRNLLRAFHKQRGTASTPPKTENDFRYVKTAKKNRLNRLGSEYFEDVIRVDSEPYFFEIDDFLGDTANSELASVYTDIVHDLRARISASRNDFGAFEKVFSEIHDQVAAQVPSSVPRRLVRVFLHYMYVRCDIGKKTK